MKADAVGKNGQVDLTETDENGNENERENENEKGNGRQEGYKFGIGRQPYKPTLSCEIVWCMWCIQRLVKAGCSYQLL